MVLDILNEAAGGGREGPFNGVDIGGNDRNYGYYLSPDHEYNPSSIVFVRKNVLINIGPTYISKKDYYPDILSLAQKIDNDIMKGASYVMLTDILSPPVIHSVSFSNNVLVEGEEATITINASDPLSQIEHYRTLGGAIKYENDPVNVFRTVADRGLFKEPFFGTHTIKIWVINQNNFFSRIYEAKLTFLDPTAVDEEGNTAETPQAFTLNQNAPNPFNQGTVIGYELTQPGLVSLRIYDLLGREVAVPVDGMKDKGHHKAAWNGRYSTGNPAASGVYLYRLEAAGSAETRRMMLVR